MRLCVGMVGGVFGNGHDGVPDAQPAALDGGLADGGGDPLKFGVGHAQPIERRIMSMPRLAAALWSK